MSPRLRDPDVDDPTLDDWLGEQGEVDWSDDPRPTASRPSGGDLPGSAAPAESSGAALPSTGARRLALVRRRRAIALVALLALALVGVGVAMTMFRSDEPAAPTTAPAADTVPPPTEPPAATEPPATTAPPPAETLSPLTITLPAGEPLALGASGEEVETLQTALTALQLDPGEVDGVFGEGTEEAVLAFQRANELPADAIVGPSTVAKLNAALAAEGITG